MSSPEKKKPNLNAEDLARPQAVIHPALDWVNGQLIMGVVLHKGGRAALSSKEGLVDLDGLGHICQRDGNFMSRVTPETAKAFIEHLEGKSIKIPERDAQEVLEHLANYLRRFVVFPEKQWAEILGVWIIGTYVFPIFQTYPYLWLTSPVPGCGKSLLGQIVANLSFNGEFMTSPTEANLFRLSELNRAVQVWDEFEISSQVEGKRFQSVKGILLNGYRNGGTVARQLGKQWETTVRYHVYCPRVLIGLSPLPRVLQERTIELRLRKREQNEEVDFYRNQDQLEEERALQSECVLAALKSASKIDHAYRDKGLRKQLEEHLGQVGREVDDIWLPLFAVAAAGSTSENIISSEIVLYQRFAEGAQKLAKRRTNMVTESAAGVPFRTPTFLSDLEGTIAATKRQVLTAALHILEWDCPVEPSDLAKRVSKASGQEVTTQWLSKKLKHLRIQAKKQRGRRVFNARAEQIREAKAQLGIESFPNQAGIPGQQGQMGQQ